MNCDSKIATRPIFYTDTLQGRQAGRDDLWAVTTEELNALEAELQAVKKAYQAHRDTKHHLAECVKCRKGMTALCSEWERLGCDVCGKLDYAMDKAAERERDSLKREGKS